MRVGHPASRVVIVALAFAIAVPSLPSPAYAASDKWSRVTHLERDSRVIVRVQDADTVTGRLIAADSYGLTVRANGQDEIVLRQLVMKVTLISRHSPIPLVIGAVARYACIRARSSR